MDDAALTAARDAAFCRYGQLERLSVDGSSCTVSINPNTPADDRTPLGQIGSVVAGPDPRRLFDAAFDWLKARGCQRVRGPIERHTWYPFRVVTDGFGSRPPLTGEPQNGPNLAAQMKDAGFEAVAWYVSTLTQTDQQVVRTTDQLQRLKEGGFTVRCFDPAQAPKELALIHALTCRSFEAPFNYMFAPIDLAEFQVVVGPGGGITPDLFLICHDASGAPAGFCYTTVEGDAASIKTLVVAPEHRGSGLGSALVALTHRRCHELGIRCVIHALMRQGGPSVSISNRGDHSVFRRYEVLERAL
jgi:GNAT superfamily N-acetyltransferase